MIAFAEGTCTHPLTKCNGYDVIVTGIDGKPEIFEDFSEHPFACGRESKIITKSGLKSNASGRYQFMLKDYDYYKRLMNLKDFGKDAQDAWALRLIQERKALLDIDAGNITDAITKVSNIWASLPGSKYGQPTKSVETLLATYDRALSITTLLDNYDKSLSDA